MKRVLNPEKYNATLTDYLREVHCVCPSCGGHAYIRAEAKYAIPWKPTNVKFTCTNCARREDWPSGNWKSNFEAFDPSNEHEPYFGYKLYFPRIICGKNISILSLEHAKDIAEYIAAYDRPSPQNSKWAMVNRLPKQLKLAKNRETVLKALNGIIKDAQCLA
jgi:hypothetical protein